MDLEPNYVSDDRMTKREMWMWALCAFAGMTAGIAGWAALAWFDL